MCTHDASLKGLLPSLLSAFVALRRIHFYDTGLEAEDIWDEVADIIISMVVDNEVRMRG